MVPEWPLWGAKNIEITWGWDFNIVGGGHNVEGGGGVTNCVCVCVGGEVWSILVIGFYKLAFMLILYLLLKQGLRANPPKKISKAYFPFNRTLYRIL